MCAWCADATRRALPQRPFAFVASGKGLLNGVDDVPMVFMCNMRFGDYLQTDQTEHNKWAIRLAKIKHGNSHKKGGKKNAEDTGVFMKVRVEYKIYWADLSPSPG